jgi:putative membrane protein
MSGLDTSLGGRWWAKALGLLLVPVVIAAVLLAATWNTDSRIHRVEAAVVNLDRAVTLNGQTVPLGRQLSAQLIDTAPNQNFTWVLADASNATAGLSSGRYAAVVTIPENFSAAATSYAGSASSAQQATIDVATSPVAGIADTALGQSVAQAAAIALNQTLTQGYLDKVYVGFNDTGKQFQTVADAATKLSDGTKALSDGLAQAAPGAKQLADGLVQITLNGGAVRSGGGSLVSGIGQYASGATQSADGAAQLAAGMSLLATGSAGLRSGVAKLDAGIVTYEAGLKQYTTGVTGILTPLPQQVDLLMGLRQIDDGLFAGGTLASYTSNANALTGTVTSTATSLTSSAVGAAGLAGNLDSLASSKIDTAAAALSCPSSVGMTGSPACIGYAAGVADAAAASKTAVTSAIAAKDSSGKNLAQELAGVSGNAATLSTVAPKVKALIDGTTTLVATADNIPSAAVLQPEKDGATQLAAGGAPLVTGLEQLRGGVSQALGGQLSLEYGITAYTSGVDQSAAGAQKLSTGLAQLADGGAPLLSGAQQYVSGVGQVLDGIDQSAPGATKLADGLQQSADGSAQLADGTTQLADGLAKGATQVPSYSTEDRTQLSKVVASPISVSNLDELVQPGAALAALLMILALWAGALATYTVLPAVRRRLAMSSSPTAALVVEALRPGVLIVVAQALLVSAVGQAFVRLPAYRWLSLTVLLVLAGVAFVAVNHALAAWAKGAGRIFAIAAAAVTAATALTSAVPGWLDVVRPLSPLSPAYDAVRAVVSGGPGITGPVFLLIAWTLIGAVFTVAAILRARTVSPAALTAIS